MATTRERTVIHRSYFNSNIWNPALRGAGVPVTRAIGMHALRHFFAPDEFRCHEASYGA
jgi:hypothetical protein